MPSDARSTQGGSDGAPRTPLPLLSHTRGPAQVGERITVAGFSDEGSAGPGEVVNPAKKGNAWTTVAPVSVFAWVFVGGWVLRGCAAATGITAAPTATPQPVPTCPSLPHSHTGPAHGLLRFGHLQGRATAHVRRPVRGPHTGQRPHQLRARRAHLNSAKSLIQRKRHHRLPPHTGGGAARARMPPSSRGYQVLPAAHGRDCSWRRGPPSRRLAASHPATRTRMRRKTRG